MEDTPQTTVERVVEVDRSGSGGWMVAVIILIIVVAGIFVWMHYGQVPATQDESANINVTIGDDSEGGNSGPQ